MTDILQEASELINGDRAKDYGDVSENFQRIAALWGAYLGHFDAFTEHDVSMMMILVKVARQAGGYHRDSVVDIAGYAALAEKVNDEAVVSAIPLGPLTVGSDFWDDIDAGIAEAQEKRERDTTQKPARVWESLCEVPHSVIAEDRTGDIWAYAFGTWGFTGEGGQRHETNTAKHGVQAWDHFGPFTEVLS